MADEKKHWDNLDGTKKAAIVLLSLGKEAATEVLRNLEDTDVVRIASQIAQLGPVPQQVQQKVLQEYTSALTSRGAFNSGGVDRATEILESALGKSKASEIVGRVRRLSAASSIRKLEQMEMDAGTIAELLKGEHPQTIALVLAQFEPQVGANLLGLLPQDLRADVATRIATMDAISPDVAEEIGV